MIHLDQSRIIGIGIFVLVLIGIGLFVRAPAPRVGADPAYGDETAAVDYDAVEAFLKKMTAKQPVTHLTLIRQSQPSPIPGLIEVKFTLEANGQRQNGLVYLSGNKIILGQIFDLATEQNLTAQHAGPPQPLRYDLKDLDLADRVPRGKPGSKLVIVEFSDFQCPFCKQATRPISDLLKKHPDEVVLYYKHFPIAQLHPLAYNMAMASECARAQKAQSFWSFHDRFFADPQIRDEAGLRGQIGQLAGTDGLDKDKFLTCYDNKEQAPRLDKDMADAQKIGVTATPTFLLNGEFVSGVQPIELFERYLKSK
ncbi:MAG: thioredoxin domain-containing protein [Nitrospirae bacterium]|nr:thioredoxin domain-containing protein [Nitrospirota bacterium]